jgi:hypothetical protein
MDFTPVFKYGLESPVRIGTVAPTIPDMIIIISHNFGPSIFGLFDKTVYSMLPQQPDWAIPTISVRRTYHEG